MLYARHCWDSSFWLNRHHQDDSTREYVKRKLHCMVGAAKVLVPESAGSDSTTGPRDSTRATAIQLTHINYVAAPKLCLLLLVYWKQSIISVRETNNCQINNIIMVYRGKVEYSSTYCKQCKDIDVLCCRSRRDNPLLLLVLVWWPLAHKASASGPSGLSSTIRLEVWNSRRESGLEPRSFLVTDTSEQLLTDLLRQTESWQVHSGKRKGGLSRTEFETELPPLRHCCWVIHKIVNAITKL